MLDTTIRVAHLITDLDTGGAEASLYNLCIRLDRSVYSNVVVSMTTKGTYGPLLESRGIAVHTLGMSRSKPGIKGIWRGIRLLRRERPQILQTWLYHADVVGLLMAPLAGARATIWNVRCSDMDMSHYSWTSRSVLHLLPWLSRWPTAVITNSEQGERVHTEMGYRPRRWLMIPNGIDVEIFRPDSAARERLLKELELPASAILVGIVARFDPMKDHRNFLRAIALARTKVPHIHAIMIGKGVDSSNDALASEIARLGLGNRISMLGERNDIPRVITGLDVAVLSSLFGEGFPNVVGEAMACEIPCVVTDVGDAARIVGDTGKVVAAGDASALSEGLIELCRLGADGRRVLGAAARRRICDLFDIRLSVTRYEHCYEEIASGMS